jgi:arylsulfatase A-like enzyme
MGSSEKYNVILIVVDSLRRDHVSCYGYPRATTPFIDQISKSSVILEAAISPSAWTLPVFASILTGTYPSKNRHSMEKLQTIMGILRFAGYRTFGATDNFFATTFQKGFDDFAFLTRRSLAHMLLCDLGGATGFVQKAVRQRSRESLQSLASGFLTNRACKEWLNKNHKAASFFMMVHYSAHWPYAPPEPFLSRFLDDSLRHEVKNVRRDVYELIFHGQSEMKLKVLKSLYDGQIAFIDSCIEDLVNHLKSLGLYEKTVIMITADHGDILGENGLLHHEFVLCEPLIRVPLVMRLPDLFEKGIRYSGLVQTLDILPTLLDYLGIECPDVTKQVQGRSILELISGLQEREFTISERADWSSDSSKKKVSYLEKEYPDFNWRKYVHEIVALRTRDYKFIWSSEGRHELYDLNRDPEETRNLITVDKARASELRIKTEVWMRSFLREEPNYASDEELEGPVKKRLKALGYL